MGWVPFKDKDYVIIDLETSSVSPYDGEILEFGAIRVNRDLEEVARYETKIKPQKPVSPGAAAVNGYTPEAWEDAPFAREVIQEIVSILDGAIFMSFNGDFDANFLKALFNELNVKNVIYTRYDIKSIAAWINRKNDAVLNLSKGNSKLATLCQGMGIDPEDDVHRAIHGAEKGLELLRACDAKIFVTSEEESVTTF